MIFFKRKFLHSLPSHHSFIHKWVHIYIYSLCVNIHTVWKSIWNMTLSKADDINKHSSHIVELWSCSSFAVYMWKDEAHVPTLLLKGALSFKCWGCVSLGSFRSLMLVLSALLTHVSCVVLIMPLFPGVFLHAYCFLQTPVVPSKALENQR